MKVPKNTILIKKYENRRLYNVNEKKYISLENVRDIIKSGKDIKVVEKKTGKDITRVILMQVLMDMSPEKLNSFPIQFLKFLITSPAPLINDYFKNFFGNQMELYMKNRDKYLSSLNSMKTNFMGSNDMFNNPFSSFFKSVNPFGFDDVEDIEPVDTSEDEPEVNDKSDEDGEDEIDEIKQMMAKLAEKMDKLEKKKK